MGLLRFYRRPLLSAEKARILVDAVASKVPGKDGVIDEVVTEAVFYVETATGSLDAAQADTLKWLLSETFEPENFNTTSFLENANCASGSLVEVGPRLNFTSAFSTNAVSICTNCGVAVSRIERYRRYLLRKADGSAVSPAAVQAFTELVHDRMTEFRVTTPLSTFNTGLKPVPVRTVPLLSEGMAALERVNSELGLGLSDPWDREYVLDLFVNNLKRDPTDVELFDFSQSNSEHSRHWFFRGRIVIDGEEQARTLMGVVQATLDAHPHNSVVAFADNSSAITGFEVDMLLASKPGEPCRLETARRLRHLLLTAETHNFPTGIAPFPGAETGTGGRIRDSHATGRGSHAMAGTTGYCVGALQIPGHELPWEEPGLPYPPAMATPLQIEIDASNGASDYGNKFGEPVVAGFTRSVRLQLPGGERREFIKPIMFTAGIGAIEEEQKGKEEGQKGMVVVKLGGPAYRIGMGGSAASSVAAGDNAAELDFNAVQRGDAEMENKVNRAIRACCDLGAANPIIAIHDQGAGGNCNVLKEIIAPAGGRIEIRKVLAGDATLSVLELWGAEYQEADALLIKPEAVPLFTTICARERAPVAYVGEVTGDGRVIVVDSQDGSHPVDLPLDAVLGKMPQKVFTYTRAPVLTASLSLPPALDIAGALDRVLRLLAVGSKRFLTNKVDRAVTGLIAQQQCVGPLHTPLADVAVLSMSHFDTKGVASSIGEQPVKGLANTAAMARMAVAESITNMASARISSLTEAKCSANWMWAAKLPHEGAALWDAAVAMADFMIATGVAVDGGKDSLSMAAKLPNGTTVKAPGTLVISLYAPCPDVTNVRTPDLKAPGASTLIVVDGAAAAGSVSANRLGGSALAQVFGQVGAAGEVPDVPQPAVLVAAFNTLQGLLDKKGMVLSVHDRSDGGTLVTALEMAFAGNCGVSIDLPASYVGEGAHPLAACFGEEAGWVLEVSDAHVPAVLSAFTSAGVAAAFMGKSLPGTSVSVSVAGRGVYSGDMRELRDMWESTSFALEKRQASPACVQQEQEGMRNRQAPPYKLTFTPTETSPAVASVPLSARPRVAVVREEGTNGDREMGAALMAAGFDAWDITMSDLLAGRARLDESYCGLVFPGGFSYGDVLDSAKGWAGSLRYNKGVWEQFKAFYERKDTWSLGVCNGCQLMALLGWVPFGPDALPPTSQPRFVHNASQRFESRWSTVKIAEGTPAIMFKGMAGSVLGVWVQHGEGMAHFPDAAIRARVESGAQVPLHYVDDAGNATEVYPLNPNGSPGGIAGMCSPDGRHLAMMPHPERVHRLWQWAWMPEAWKGGVDRSGQALQASPWLTMFQNARTWVEQNKA